MMTKGIALLSLFILVGVGCVSESPSEPVPVSEPYSPEVIYEIDGYEDDGVVVSEFELVGAWSHEQGGGVEEIQFEESGGYSSYLHDRLFEIGTWEYVAGVLEISSDGEVMKTYRSVRIEDDTMYLERDDGVERYKRVESSP